MTTRQRIRLATTPHVIELEGVPGAPADVVELLFTPEVLGEDYLEAYGVYQDRLKAAGFAGDPQDLDLESFADVTSRVKEATDASREFIAAFMLEPSRELFLAQMPEEPAGNKRKAKGKDVVLVYKMRLPQWVLIQLVRAVTELYGDRPTGPSNGSAPASSPAGNRSTAPSRSKASTRAGGR